MNKIMLGYWSYLLKGHVPRDTGVPRGHACGTECTCWCSKGVYRKGWLCAG